MNDRALDWLFRRFRDRRDGAALAAVFDATARELLGVACHLQRDPTLAEDLVQATFVVAIRNAERYDGSSPVKAWLYGILWREAARARRDAARAVDPARLLERRQPEPIEGLLERELPDEVARALARLPRAYREVLEPLIRDGRPASEIARELERSPGTVRSQIHRGLELLRRALPSGLGSVSGLAILPRGLDTLRGEVLNTAGFSPGIAGAPIALGAALLAFFTSKVAALGTAAATAAGVALWLAHDMAAVADGGEGVAAGGAWGVAQVAGPAERPDEGKRALVQPDLGGTPASSTNLGLHAGQGARPWELNRNEAAAGLLGDCPTARTSLQVVMNSVADILEAEGRGQALSAGSVLALDELQTADRRAIVRNSPRGGRLFLADRARFSILFELLESAVTDRQLTLDQCALVQLLAVAGDEAYRSIQPDLSVQTGAKQDR